MCYRLFVTMSATVTKIPDRTGAPASEHREHVLVVCQSGPNFARALAVALDTAEAAGAMLSVAAVSQHERTDVGCAACRTSAMFRNELCLEYANTEIEQAHELIRKLDGPGGTTEVVYKILKGALVPAVTRYASDRSVDLILLPAPKRGFFRVGLARRRAERLRGRGDWSLQFVPEIG